MVRRCLTLLFMASVLAGCAAAPAGLSRSSGSRPTGTAARVAPAHATQTVPVRTTVPPVTTTRAPTTTTTSPATTTTAGRTEQVVYQAFSGSRLASGLSVAGTDRGTCDPYATADGRDYFRCLGTVDLGGHTSVYDPCFAGAGGTASPLACPVSAIDEQVVLFTATSVDDFAPPVAIDRPWAMQLVTGQLCLFTSGAWGGLGPYACSSFAGPSPQADCHQPTVGSPWWTAACQVAENDQSAFAAASVEKVWF